MQTEEKSTHGSNTNGEKQGNTEPHRESGPPGSNGTSDTLRRAHEVHRACHAAIFSAQSEIELLEAMCRIIVEKSGYRCAWAGYAEQDDARSVLPVAYAGYAETDIEKLRETWADSTHGKSPAATTIRTGIPTICKDIPSDPAHAPLRDEAAARGYSSIMALPIIATGETIGALSICAIPPDAFDTHETMLLTQVANDISYAVESIRARDESERIKESLRRSEEKYSKLFHQSNDAIFLHDLEGNIIDINKQGADCIGYEREEMLRMNVRDLHPPEDLEQSKNAFETIAREGHVKFEIHFKKKSGEIFPTEVSSSLFEIGEQKVIQGIVHDLTERQKAERALRESQELYETLVRTSPEAITTTDLSGNITYASPNTLALHGYGDAEELIGRNALELIAPEEHDRAMQNLQRTLTGGFVRDIEYTLVKKDGSRFTGEMNAALVKDESGKPLFFIATVRDVTDRKHMEEQLRQSQKMEALGALAGGIAHDFNNLLIPILGYADLLALKLEKNEPLLSRYVEEIKKTADRATVLTKQLLALGRRQMLRMIVLDLNALVSNLEDLLQRFMGEDIDFSLNLERGLLPINADPGQVELIIINLVVNACDAMPEGGSLTIQTENVSIDRNEAGAVQETEPGDYVRLTVKDTGIGMDDKTRERIFEPFFTTKEPGHGTGLGLATVYGIVKQHEGWIDVSSIHGKGSSFMIYFPASLRIADDHQDKDTKTIDIRGNNERVLLVEDDEAVRNLTARILASNGYTVLEAHSGKEALDIIAREEGKIDVVFSDVVLPGKSGIQLAEELLSREPDLKVILSSGYTTPKTQWDIIQEKGYRFIQKPYTMIDLLKVMKEICEAD